MELTRQKAAGNTASGPVPYTTTVPFGPSTSGMSLPLAVKVKLNHGVHSAFAGDFFHALANILFL